MRQVNYIMSPNVILMSVILGWITMLTESWALWLHSPHPLLLSPSLSFSLSLSLSLTHTHTIYFLFLSKQQCKSKFDLVTACRIKVYFWATKDGEQTKMQPGKTSLGLGIAHPENKTERILNCSINHSMMRTSGGMLRVLACTKIHLKPLILTMGWSVSFFQLVTAYSFLICGSLSLSFS